MLLLTLLLSTTAFAQPPTYNKACTQKIEWACDYITTCGYTGCISTSCKKSLNPEKIKHKTLPKPAVPCSEYNDWITQTPDHTPCKPPFIDCIRSTTNKKGFYDLACDSSGYTIPFSIFNQKEKFLYFIEDKVRNDLVTI
tara:strand:- start:1057 stop:1476 length:420 start_codon:yes stop_codon:yes gene_type:complete